MRYAIRWFKCKLKPPKKCKIWLKCEFSHTTVNRRKTFNAPIDGLMCPLQIINDIEPLSSTLHGVNACFIHHPSNVKNYSIGHKSETDRPKPKKKEVILDNLSLHLSANFEVKIQNIQCYRSRLTFLHLKNRHLTAQQMAPRWDTQKSKIGKAEHPRIHLWTDSWSNTSVISVL